MTLNIGIRFEGGIGDVLLFNRFIPAIKEYYGKNGEEVRFNAYLDTEGNISQEQALRLLYGDFYNTIQTIPRKKYKKFMIKSQFGVENQIGFIENVPDDWADKMSQENHLFIDGHIDSLKWLDDEYDWFSYFRKFPTPQVSAHMLKDEPYLVTHLVSTSSEEHRIEQWYLDKLLNDINNLGIKTYVIGTAELESMYYKIDELENLEWFNKDLEEVSLLISNARGMISTDSGLRVIAYGYGIPVVSFSKQCVRPGQIPLSHIIRWNPFPETTFPLHWDSNDIVSCLTKIMSNPVYRMFPQLNDWENELIKRKYVVHESSEL